MVIYQTRKLVAAFKQQSAQLTVQLLDEQVQRGSLSPVHNDYFSASRTA